VPLDSSGAHWPALSHLVDAHSSEPGHAVTALSQHVPPTQLPLAHMLFALHVAPNASGVTQPTLASRQ
jgi:hypothetical protein